MTVHAPLNASSAERWWECPGSIRLINTLIAMPASSIYAARGTAMHEAAQQWLTADTEPDWPFETFNGFELEIDEIEAVQSYVATLREDQEKYGGKLLVEHKFSLASIRDDMWGTNDAMLIGCKDRVLRIYDFKGGKGVPVSVARNFQMLYYGYGALLTVPDINADVMELVIVQPRCPHAEGPVRRWRIDLIDAFDWSQDLLQAAERTDGPNAPLKAGDWCRWCPANGICKEFERHAFEVTVQEFSSIEEVTTLPDPRTITPEQMADILPKLGILEDWISAVRAHAHGEAEAGRILPGFKLVAKRGTRQWQHSEDETVRELKRAGLIPEQLYTAKIISPAMAEKMLPKERRKEVLAKLAVMVSSGTNLVPMEDPRLAVEGTGVAVFAALPGGNEE